MARKLIKAVNIICFFLYNRILSLFVGLDENRVTFLSEAHMELNGNLECVHEYLGGTKYVRKVHIKSDRRNILSFKETFSIWRDITVSKYIILDDFYGLTAAMKVREGQELIQLWHGAGAYKKFGYSRQIDGKKINIHGGYKKYTKAIVSSERIKGCYGQAFGLPEDRIYATGIPRTDILLDDEKKEEIKEVLLREYPEFKDKKIVIWAPTYRGEKVEDADYDFNYANIDGLVKALGENYVVLTKWHPALRNNINRGKVNPSKVNMVYDFSQYKNINDLLIVADILVTDYSSVIFDYFLLNKPVVYFSYDMDEYTRDRGLYFDFSEYVFGEVVTSHEDLIEAIKKENMCNSKREKFRLKFMESCNGDSTKKVIELIFKGEEKHGN